VKSEDRKRKHSGGSTASDAVNTSQTEIKKEKKKKKKDKKEGGDTTLNTTAETIMDVSYRNIISLSNSFKI
jgi:hypothetical protein